MLQTLLLLQSYNLYDGLLVEFRGSQPTQIQKVKIFLILFDLLILIYIVD